MKRHTRDPRFDFFRGIALLMIYNLHLLANRFAWIHLGAICYTAGAEIFVYISGYVCGMTYMRAFDRDGFFACQTKALKRCGQLYIAHVLTAATAFAALWIFSQRFEIDYSAFRMDVIQQQPGQAAFKLATLQYTPYLLDILKLYMMLLPALPAMLILLRRWPTAALGLSAAGYAAAQIWPLQTALPDFPQGTVWTWNPLAWQFLFFIGVFFGVSKVRGKQLLPRGSAWLIIALAILTILLIAKQTVDFNRIDWLPGSWRLTSKPRLAPLRLISFLLLAYLSARLLSPNTRFWRGPITAPIIICGRHALAVFCLGVVLDYIGSALASATGGGAALEAAISLGGIALMILLAWTLTQRKARKRKNPQIEARRGKSPIDEATLSPAGISPR